MISVFVGPSLPRARALAAVKGKPVSILPPAAQGDIYRCWRSRPDVIVLIDGYFHDVPAPWHKEILWALSHGTPVIGASSMGALRAAELEPFGMVGVGAIFESYRDGRLVADDEVTLLHADEELNYMPLSVPLVNIRATFDSALQCGVIDQEEHLTLLGTAVSLHYGDRQYERILSMHGSSVSLTKLEEWLVHKHVDQKALDAEAALTLAASGVDIPTPGREWSFEYTAMWGELTHRHWSCLSDAHDFADDDVLDRLEADSAEYRRTAIPALARLLAADFVRQRGRVVDADELATALEALRRRLGLERPTDVTQWMADNQLNLDGLVHLLESEVHLATALVSFANDLEPHLLDELRVSNEYPTSINKNDQTHFPWAP